MGNIDVTGYLERLGLGAEPPGIAALRRLHAAHVERVPYEPLEIQLGRPTALDPAASAARILRGRGGYCYHLNGAFSALLLPFGVRLHQELGVPVGLMLGAVGGTPSGAWLTEEMFKADALCQEQAFAGACVE